MTKCETCGKDIPDTKTEDCLDCEDFLQLGIDAFKWLGRADRVIRSAVYRGLAEHDPSLDVALATLYAEWLRPCTFAERWIAQQESRGFRVDNLAEFRACCQEVRAIVEALDTVLAELKTAGPDHEAMEKLRQNDSSKEIARLTQRVDTPGLWHAVVHGCHASDPDPRDAIFKAAEAAKGGAT